MNPVKNLMSVFIFIIYLALFIPELNADSKLTFSDTQPQISMDFQDAGLKDILKVFSIQSGLNFIDSEGVQERKITLYLDRVPLNKAMDKLFKANNLSYELDREANIFIVKDWGKPQIETITKVFYLKYATVSSSSLKEEMSSQIKSTTGTSSSGAGGGSSSGKWATEADTGITKAVKKLLSPAGSVIEDFRTNSLIVTDIPNQIAVITQTIAALDVQIPQVMLEVEMLDVNKNAIDRLGIKFADSMTSAMFTTILTGAKISTGFPIPDQFYQSKGFTKTFTPGTLDFFNTNTYKVAFDFIKQQSDTKVLARPRILTLNNETAEIKISTQEAVGSITTTQGQGTASTTTTSAERIETGVVLRVTPQINLDTGEITMFIMPSVKDATTSTFNTSFKDPEERSTKSTVRIKDGETVIIGGLIRNERSETNTKVPLLGDIPLIGGLFRHRYKDKDKQRELLIFITPHIVKDIDLKLAQTKKVTFPEREQNTTSSLSRESAIDASLNRFEKQR